MRQITDPRCSIVVAVWAVLFVLVVGITGCVRGVGPYQPVQLPAGDSAIYFYRARSLLSPGTVEVFVDQVAVASLRRNTHLVVIVSPGEHLVRVQRRSDATRLVGLGPGESLYLEVGAALLGGKVSLSDPGESVAKARIAQTRAVALSIRAVSDE